VAVSKNASPAVVRPAAALDGEESSVPWSRRRCDSAEPHEAMGRLRDHPGADGLLFVAGAGGQAPARSADTEQGNGVGNPGGNHEKPTAQPDRKEGKDIADPPGTGDHALATPLEMCGRQEDGR